MPDPQTRPWLERTWVKLLIVALLAVAFVVELLWLEGGLWLWMWGGALAYALWDFFLRRRFGKPPPESR